MKTFEEAMVKLGQTEALCDELGEALDAIDYILASIQYGAPVVYDFGPTEDLVERWRASQAARGET